MDSQEHLLQSIYTIDANRTNMLHLWEQEYHPEMKLIIQETLKRMDTRIDQLIDQYNANEFAKLKR